MYFRQSSVFLANRLTDLVTMRSILPSSASERPESPSATMAAVRLPFRKKYAKNGMTKMRNTDMAFGTVKF